MNTNATCFVLTILDTAVNNSPSLEGVEVSVHQSQQGAEEQVTIYALTQLWDRFEEDFKASEEGSEDINSLNDLLEWVTHEYPVFSIAYGVVLDMLERFTVSNYTAFEYKIEEKPAMGFLEQLDQADGVKVDDNYICQAGLNNPFTSAEDTSFIDASMVDDEYNKFDYFIGLEDVAPLTYDVSAKEWSHPEGYQISFFKMS